MVHDQEPEEEEPLFSKLFIYQSDNIAASDYKFMLRQPLTNDCETSDQVAFDDFM